MVRLNYTDIQKPFDECHIRDKVVEFQLQPGGVGKFKIVDSKLPIFRNLLSSEALKLLKLAKPYYVFIRNADPWDAAFWWNELRASFTIDVHEIYFSLIGLGDRLKPDLKYAAVVMKEAVEKMTNMEPDVFTIHASEKLVSFLSKLPGLDFRSFRSNTFTMEVMGNYNLRTTNETLFPDILTSQLPKLRKLYLISEYPCLTCTQRIFESMKWFFPENIGSNPEHPWFWGTNDSSDIPSPLRDYARRFTKFREFTIEKTNTKVRCFFGEVKSADWALGNYYLC